MKNIIINSILVTLFTLTNTASYGSSLPDHIIPVTEPSDIADFKIVDNALDDLTQSIGNCLESGQGDYEKCACLFPDKTNDLEVAIQDILKKHPAWGQEGKGLYYYDKVKKSSSNIFISAIEMQLVSQCKT